MQYAEQTRNELAIYCQLNVRRSNERANLAQAQRLMLSEYEIQMWGSQTNGGSCSENAGPSILLVGAHVNLTALIISIEQSRSQLLFHTLNFLKGDFSIAAEHRTTPHPYRRHHPCT
jgi:hypothetical protein